MWQKSFFKELFSRYLPVILDCGRVQRIRVLGELRSCGVYLFTYCEIHKCFEKKAQIERHFETFFHAETSAIFFQRGLQGAINH